MNTKTSHKKRKTYHQHPSASNKPHDRDLTHNEIWDDSALINSWNEALEEYRYYHSLAVRGKMVEVEGVLDEAEGAEGVNGQGDGGEGEGEREDGEDGETVGGGLDGEDAQDGRDEGEVVEEGEYHDGDYQGTRNEGDEAQGGGKAAEDCGAFIGPSKPGAAPSITAAPSASAPSPPQMRQAASMPQALLGGAGGQDEAMKNLMMSWYYAGYYTGFYEGQRQGGQRDGQQVGNEATSNGVRGGKHGR